MIIGVTQNAESTDLTEVTGTTEVVATLEGTENNTEGMVKTIGDTAKTIGGTAKTIGGMVRITEGTVKTSGDTGTTRVIGISERMRITDIGGNIKVMNTIQITVQLMHTLLDHSKCPIGRIATPVMRP